MSAPSRSELWARRIATFNLALSAIWLVGAAWLFIAGNGLSWLTFEDATDVVALAVAITILFGAPLVLLATSFVVLRRPVGPVEQVHGAGAGEESVY